jgi:hypothetical protein
MHSTTPPLHTIPQIALAFSPLDQHYTHYPDKVIVE